MTNEQLRALSATRTYVGSGKSSTIAAAMGGRWVWRFEDPFFGGTFVAFTGKLEECAQLQHEYENPTLDLPF